MPEHYSDWWWEDLPPKAQEAAIAMGYTAATWDDDAHIPYDSKTVTDASLTEKSAAMYLGMSPIDSKCDVWWSETDDITKKHAQALGWDQHKWDDDWEIHDLPCEHLYWKELSTEQTEAAQFFGYSQPTWDETDEEAGLPNWGSAEQGKKKPSSLSGAKKSDNKTSSSEEKKADEEKDETAAKAKPFKNSALFGSDEGTPYKLGNVKHISKMTIYADGHVVNGIEVATAGMIGKKKGKEHTFELANDEFIIRATVRAHKHVQSLEFRTNKGQTLGPCGGKGFLLRDKAGEEVKVEAPFKYQLVGFQGKSDDHLNSIVLVWGGVPNLANK